MTDVFKSQIIDLEKIVPDFKVASAVAHYDESSPHLHIVGVAIKNGNKNGMKKQVGKSTIFTKESLRSIQDTMRIYCIKSFNEVYETYKTLKTKETGRNTDIQSRHMHTYSDMQKKANTNKKRLDDINAKVNVTIQKSAVIQDIITNLKPTKLNKENFIINDEQIKEIASYTELVDNSVKGIKNVSDLTIIMDKLKEDLENNDDFVEELENKIYKQDKRITYLEKQIVTKTDKISEQRKEIKKLEKDVDILSNTIELLSKLWQALLDFLQNKMFSSKKEDAIYEKVVNDLKDVNILDNKDIKYIKENNYNKNYNDYEL